MSHERSDRVWDVYRESADKLDYFILGLAGALTGYLGKDLALSPVGLNASSAELASVLSFAVAMFAGFKRIEWNVTAIGANHRRLHHGEAAGSLVDMAQKSDALINVATGDVLPRGEAFLRAQGHKQASDALNVPINKAIARAEAAYRWRNRFLYLGVILLIAGRVIKAYGL